MAASSPAKSSSSAAEGTSIAAAAASVAALSGSHPSKTLRGLNKPKCIKCGNVARSRCPYQSCKSCCAKAQNPCHIHVLKGSSSLPDKPPSSSSPLFDQQSTETPHSGNSHRLRQLSTNFAQFNNLQTPVRSRKPLTRKDAQVINEWRFLKLKEFKEGNIAAETESFDRYMQNVDLLEEVFMVNLKTDGQIQDEQAPMMKPAEVKDLVHDLKLKFQSDPVRKDNFRKRIQSVVDHGLKKLAKFEPVDGGQDGPDDTGRSKMRNKSCQKEKDLALNELVDKLHKARNEDDFKACWETASQIFEWNTKTCQMSCDGLIFSEKNSEAESGSSTGQRSFYDPQRWVTPATIDEDAIYRINEQFSSLEAIEDL